MKILKILGNIGYFILILPLALGLLLAMTPLFIWVCILAFVEFIFKKIRKDPVVSIPKYSIPLSYEYPTNLPEYKQRFESYIDVLRNNVDSANFTNTTLFHNSIDDEEVVNLRTVITSRHGSAKVVMKAEIVNDTYYSSTDPEVGPYLSVNFTSLNEEKLRFDIYSRDDMDFIVSILSNGFNKSKSGQIWSKRVNGVFIVTYKIEEVDNTYFTPDYGYRAIYNDKKVRKYFFDD